MPKCHVCGGTEFAKEEGFLYCCECQTRCKGVSEQVFESFSEVNKQKTKIKIPKATTNDENWTTWEAYNYVLKGMVDELILSLGASKKLKIVVFQLWARYLQKIDVAFLTLNRKLPKLGPSYCERDAQILFSWPVKSKSKKKRCRSNASVVSSDTSFVPSSKSRASAKRALITAEHDQWSFTDGQSTSVSLDQQSVSTDFSHTTSSKSTFSRRNKYMSEEAVCYNNRVKKRENILQKQPWKKKIKIQPTTTTFLCKVKLLAIIHLGLILCEDDIQLSDLLRWIREGHLSYCSVMHFLPPTMVSPGKRLKGLEFNNVCPSHLMVRKVAGKMAMELGVNSLPVPFFPNLIQRYAKELQLPGDLADFAIKLYADCQPKMPLKSEVDYVKLINGKKSCTHMGKEIPNYEGRAMAILLFAMKLLFALDGYTELIQSEFAYEANKILGPVNGTNISSMNGSSPLQHKLFVWNDWVNYIEFRNSMISRWHYPSYTECRSGLVHLNCERENSIPDSTPSQNIYKYLGFCHQAFENRVKNIEEKDVEWKKFMKEQLKDLNEMSSASSENVKIFQPSLTPCHSYMEELCRENAANCLGQDAKSGRGPCRQLLHAQFRSTSIAFILDAKLIVEALEKKNVTVDINKGSAMGKKGSKYVKFCEPISSHSAAKNKTNDLMEVQINDACEYMKEKTLDWFTVNDRNQLLKQIESVESKLLKMKSNRRGLNKPKSVPILSKKSNRKQKNKIGPKTKGTVINRSTPTKVVAQRRLKLMLPYRQVWLFYGAFHELTEEKFGDLCLKMPSSFYWLLHICASMLEMSEMSLYSELVDVELVHKHIKSGLEIHASDKRYECVRTNVALAAW